MERCYHAVTLEMTWDDSRKYCKEHGMTDLLVLEDEDEMQYVTDFVHGLDIDTARSKLAWHMCSIPTEPFGPPRDSHQFLEHSGNNLRLFTLQYP